MILHPMWVMAGWTLPVSFMMACWLDLMVSAYGTVPNVQTRGVG